MRPNTLLQLSLLLLVGLVLPAAAAVQITGVSPVVAPPGATVTVTGGPFRSDAGVLVGEREVRPETVQDRRLTFTVPSLPPGQYALRVVEQGRVSPQSFNLTVTEPVPRITGLRPDTIMACQESGPLPVTIEGSGFVEGVTILVDGAGVAIDSRAEDQVVFTPPLLAGGLHQVTAVNPGGSRSLPRALEVDATPVIHGVSIGENSVTSYEVLIEGENFLAASQLIVDGRRIPLSGHSFPGEGSARYVDCNAIVYTRHPYSSDPKPTAIQIVNPGGAQTPVYHTEIP